MKTYVCRFTGRKSGSGTELGSCCVQVEARTFYEAKAACGQDYEIWQDFTAWEQAETVVR